jgi:riboflavin kinase/FMN adenylyltransferase
MEAGEFPIWLQKTFPSLQSLHVGTNFQYGRNRAGNNLTLKKDAAELGIKVHFVDPVILENEPVSSSRIRAALTSGDISVANQMLLRPYEAEGTIVPGKQIGRRIGFPTINIDWHPELIPAFGVYAVELVTPNGVAEPSVANWGLRPTVETAALKPLLEIHLLRPTETLPAQGESLRVRWLEYIRPEKKFTDLSALEQQIKSDVQRAKAVHGLS